MKKIKKQFMVYLFIGMLPCFSFGQSVERQVIGFNGGTTILHNKVISYTAGETVISTIGSNSNNFLTQGFLQPDKITVGTVSIAGEDVDIKIFPNPTQDQLNIELNSITRITDLEIQIINYLGQAVSQIQSISSPSQAAINCDKLVAGYYFLSIKSRDQHRQKVLSFVKID